MAVLNLQNNGSGNMAVLWCATHNVWEMEAPDYIQVGTVDDAAVHGYGNKWGSNIGITNVTIPQSSTILSAYLIFTGFQADSLNSVNTRITGKLTTWDGVSPTLAQYQAARGTEVGGADNTGRTTAQVTWNSLASFVLNTQYQSPSITAIIQEIVNQGGWSSGSNLMLFWDDHRGDSTQIDFTRRVAYAGWVGDQQKGPLLHIEYIGATYPSNPSQPLPRVSSLVHRWSSGVDGNRPRYELEIMTGGLSSYYQSPLGEKEVTPTVPTYTINKVPYKALTTYDYAVWLSQHTYAQIIAIWGHRPTFNEWVSFMEGPGSF